MGLLDWFRRSRDAADMKKQVGQPIADDREREALGSLADRMADDHKLTGAYEVTEAGHVRFETAQGHTISPGNSLAEESAALVRGRHYTTWVETIRQLKRDGRVEDALTLALECVDATEREARVSGMSPAPAYTEMAAVIYRQRRDYAAEVAIIERFVAARDGAKSKNPGVGPGRLAERLVKARALLERSRTDG